MKKPTKNSHYQKPHWFWYRFLRFLSLCLGKFVFKIKIRRNEIKGKKGGYIIVCNHECALDFLYLMKATRRRATFVISKTFHDSLPFNKIVNSLHFISKQQFQTDVVDLVKMKEVVDSGSPLIIFPAGMMPENGLSTPIPPSTYKFLKWLNVDIYAGQITGSYFIDPKWQKGFRKGRSFIDIYKLFDKEELKTVSLDDIKHSVENAILFDAYYVQEKELIKYKNGNKVEGLEKVLYQCPCCLDEESMMVRDGNTLYCSKCGASYSADEYGFLHANQESKEYRHPSHWDIDIYERLRDYVKNVNPDYGVSSNADLWIIDPDTHKYIKVGDGVISLSKGQYNFKGTFKGKEFSHSEDLSQFFVLPNSPLRNSLEIQDGGMIYRYILTDEHAYVTKWMHLVKIYHELATGLNMKVYPKEDK